MKKNNFTVLILFILMISLVALGAEPSVLSTNVKEVTARLQDLALYPTLSKKRMYGALHKGGAIRFDLRASESGPQSLGIGIAGDGSLKEWQLTVYSGPGSEDTAPILRKEKVVGENQWVFEILAPPDDVIIEIRNISSSNSVAVVEVVHGFYFGYSVDKENNTKPNTTNPGQKQNPTEPEKLSPTDVQNRVEFLRVPLTND